MAVLWQSTIRYQLALFYRILWSEIVDPAP